MSKQAYTQGVVIIKCDGCKNLHLMADHLGWFDTTQKSQGTIEDIMRAKGESVTRLAFDPSTIEAGQDAKKTLNDMFASATKEDLKEIEDGLLEWMPKVEASGLLKES